MTLLQKSIYTTSEAEESVYFSILDLQRSVMCHGKSSRPEKYWAGRRDTSVTDPQNVTLLSAKQSQTSRPDMNRVLTLGFVFDGEVSPIGEVSPFLPLLISRDKITAMTAT